MFRSDKQRRAMFANMGGVKFSHQPIVVVRPHAAIVARQHGPELVPRRQSGLEILGQAGERLAGGVVGVFPSQPGEGEGDGLIRTNAISGLWPGDEPGENLEDLLVGITSAMWPDSSEGRVVDNQHYYVVVE